MAVMMEKTAYITSLCYILKERELFLTSQNMLANEQRSMESEKNFAGAAVQRVTCLPVAEAVLEENSNLLFAEQIVNNIFKRKRIFQFTEFFNRMQTKLGLIGSLAFGAVPA